MSKANPFLLLLLLVLFSKQKLNQVLEKNCPFELSESEVQ
jgi:hypothetical protein